MLEHSAHKFLIAKQTDKQTNKQKDNL